MPNFSIMVSKDNPVKVGIILFALVIISLLSVSIRSYAFNGRPLTEVMKFRSSFIGTVPELQSPMEMIVSDGCIVVYENQGSFKIYDTPSADAADLRIPGPQTIATSKFVDVRSIIPLPDGFLFFDQDYTANKVSYRGEHLSLEEISVNNLRGPLNGILPFKDGYLSLSPLFDCYNYHDCKTGKSTVFCRNPEWNDGVEDGSNYLFKSSSVVIHPGGGLVAVFYIFHDRIIYYDSTGRVIKDVSLHLGGNQDDRWPGTPSYYNSIVASNERLIVVSYGKYEYHFFDWNGNLRKRVRLDRVLFPMAYDFSSNSFYGIDRSESPMKMYSVRIGFESGNTVSYKAGASQIMKR